LLLLCLRSSGLASRSVHIVISTAESGIMAEHNISMVDTD
jgi:hypothetical protein